MPILPDFSTETTAKLKLVLIYQPICRFHFLRSPHVGFTCYSPAKTWATRHKVGPYHALDVVCRQNYLSTGSAPNIGKGEVQDFGHKSNSIFSKLSTATSTATKAALADSEALALTAVSSQKHARLASCFRQKPGFPNSQAHERRSLPLSCYTSAQPFYDYSYLQSGQLIIDTAIDCFSDEVYVFH